MRTIAALALLLCLAACGGGDPDDGAPTSALPDVQIPAVPSRDLSK